MDAIPTKERLHLRIEQANDRLLEALGEVVEVLFKTYQPETVDQEIEEQQPLTIADLEARAKASREDVAAGRLYSREEVAAELGL